jgi:hypothetical protein
MTKRRQDPEETTRQKLLNAQRRYLDAVEAEQSLPMDAVERMQKRVESTGLRPGHTMPARVLSRKAAKRKRKSRRDAGATTWEKRHASLGIREILRPFPGGRRLLDRVPTSEAPMTAKEYARYLKTPHWQEFNRNYREADDVLHFCFVCSNSSYELHHHTYERIGQEEMADVVPLCRAHHEAAHQAIKARQTTLAKAHVWVKQRVQAGQPLGLRARRWKNLEN